VESSKPLTILLRQGFGGQAKNIKSGKEMLKMLEQKYSAFSVLRALCAFVVK
jgi:hypothetical protein